MLCHLSLGINVSILLILLIFGVLFSLPSKLLFNTRYGTLINESENIGEPNVVEKEITVDFRSLKLCENYKYQSTVKSVFFSNYDVNCTRTKRAVNKKPEPKVRRKKSKLRTTAENAGIIATQFNEENDESIIKNNHKKSISIAGHILAIMLIGSAIAALVEVLRARLFAVKEPRVEGSATAVRRSSFVDVAQRRHVRRDTIQAQKSFEIQGLLHPSALRLFGARPPPLLRRASFPAQSFIKKDIPVSTTGTGWICRRPSFVIDTEEDVNGMTDFRRHSRLIRRH